MGGATCRVRIEVRGSPRKRDVCANAAQFDPSCSDGEAEAPLRAVPILISTATLLGIKRPILSRVSSFKPWKFVLVAHRQVCDRCTQAARGQRGGPRVSAQIGSAHPAGQSDRDPCTTPPHGVAKRVNRPIFRPRCDITLVTSAPNCALAVG